MFTDPPIDDDDFDDSDLASDDYLDVRRCQECGCLLHDFESDICSKCDDKSDV